MQTLIEEYIAIENNPRNHRKKSQLIAQLLAKHPGPEHTSLEDLLAILDQLKRCNAKIRMPLFAQLIYPVLEREIEADNLQAIPILLQHTTLLNNYTIMQKLSDGYSARALIERYLGVDPENQEILMKKEALLSHDLYHAVHELPRGILYSMNGATLDGCQELLGLLEEYKSTCQKLAIDRAADIQYYDIHFQGYRDYLLYRHHYKNYLDYVQQHHLEVQKPQIYYFA